ncbi:L,D-transpeptidase catalytic domain [Tranquillimonas rosea]|uniref:L,D-transpeptidase catalytic domain n=1 Tax=Tranquillimonas rosea TaxID=641238 RepID=A0A1H9UI13_9RHOB|nr:L,D-transpeptidase family protein [Tranquillimonas rosea]SES08787.1 L,D-transpeptidase catalytic domain [Tranquillimonas rosea]
MNLIKVLATLALVLAIAGCGNNSKFRSYDGPEVTQLMLFKEQRQLYLMHGQQTLKKYDVGLGFAPEGHKRVEGDGRTPEGYYYIDKRNPNSKYHLSIGISYPNPQDVEVARSMNLSPGGNIFIHGRGPLYRRGLPDDWTAGCISVKDKEIEQIYAMVEDGTPIAIYP